jgi:hypothetical protein
MRGCYSTVPTHTHTHTNTHTPDGYTAHENISTYTIEMKYNV